MSVLNLRKYKDSQSIDAERLNEPYFKIFQDYNGFLTDDNFSSSADLGTTKIENFSVRSRKLAPTKQVILGGGGLTTSYADLTGLTSGTITLATTSNILVVVSLNFPGADNATGACYGELQLDGVSQAGEIKHTNNNALAGQFPCGNVWILSSIAAGGHIIKVRGKKSINAGSVSGTGYMFYTIYSI